MNVGAVNKEDSGLYFSWGNTEGHAVNSGYDFSEETYNATPGAAIATNLSLSQDAARANLGAEWRIPTSAEFHELYDNCTFVWTTLNHVNGILFKSKMNGKTLFFPAAGFYNGTSLVDRSTYGYYWSSTYLSVTEARDLRFNNSNVYPQGTNRRQLGFVVRAVMKL